MPVDTPMTGEPEGVSRGRNPSLLPTNRNPWDAEQLEAIKEMRLELQRTRELLQEMRAASRTTPTQVVILDHPTQPKDPEHQTQHRNPINANNFVDVIIDRILDAIIEKVADLLDEMDDLLDDLLCDGDDRTQEHDHRYYPDHRPGWIPSTGQRQSATPLPQDSLVQALGSRKQQETSQKR